MHRESGQKKGPRGTTGTTDAQGKGVWGTGRVTRQDKTRGRANRKRITAKRKSSSGREKGPGSQWYFRTGVHWFTFD